MNKQYALLALMLFGIGIFNITDYYFTLEAISLGAHEGNPIMDAILHTPFFPIVKLLLVPGLLVFIWVIRSRIERLRSLIVIAFAGYLMVNVYHLYWLIQLW